jgi:hypothetical protein
MERRWFFVVCMARSAERERRWSGVVKVTDVSWVLKRARSGWDDSLSTWRWVMG